MLVYQLVEGGIIGMRFKKITSKILLPVLLIFLLISPAWAYSPLDAKPYTQLESSTLYFEELINLSLYLFDCVIMDYELAMLTGDLSFLNEIKPLLEKARQSLELVVDNVPSCGSSALANLSYVTHLINDNIALINNIISTTNSTSVYNTAEIKGLITKVDIINDIALNKINPAIVPGEIDDVLLGAISLCVRMNQQILVKSIYIKLNPSAKRNGRLNEVSNEVKYQLEVFKALYDRRFQKATDPTEVQNKKVIYDAVFDIYNQTASVCDEISKFNLPGSVKLNLNNKFITTMEQIEEITRDGVLNGAFG